MHEEENGDMEEQVAVETPQHEKLFEQVQEYLSETGDQESEEAEIFLDILVGAWDDAKNAGDAPRFTAEYGRMVTALKRKMAKVKPSGGQGFGGINLADLMGTANLPEFAGNYAEFDAFQKKFYVEVDAKEGFSEFEKLNRLKLCLKGEAKMLIEKYDITKAGDYELAKEKLKSTYESQYATFKAHMNMISELKRCVAGESEKMVEIISTISNGYDKLVNAISRNNSTPKETLFELWCVSKMEEYFDEGTLESWRRVTKKDKLPTLDEITNFGLERARKWSEDGSRKRKSQEMDECRVEKKPRIDGMTYAMCVFCNRKGHQLRHCGDFKRLSIDQRQAAARNAGKCQGCFGLLTHMNGKCPTCPICKGNHHTSFCPRAK